MVSKTQGAAIQTIAKELARPSPLERLADQAKSGTAENASVITGLLQTGDVVDRITNSPFQAFLQSTMPAEERAQWGEMKKVGDQIKLQLGEGTELPHLFTQMRNDPAAKALVGQLDAALEGQLKPELMKTLASSIEKAEQKLVSHDYVASARYLAADLGISLSDANLQKVGELLKAESKKTTEAMRGIMGNIDKVGAGAILQALFADAGDSLDKLDRIKKEVA